MIKRILLSILLIASVILTASAQQWQPMGNTALQRKIVGSDTIWRGNISGSPFFIYLYNKFRIDSLLKVKSDSVNNGLSKVAGITQLGGSPLIHDVNIGLAGNSFNLSDVGNPSLGIINNFSTVFSNVGSDGSTSVFSMQSGGSGQAGFLSLLAGDSNGNSQIIEIGLGSAMTVTDQISNRGLENGGRYEANFTQNSLTTKRYVDSVASGGGGSFINNIFGTNTTQPNSKVHITDSLITNGVARANIVYPDSLMFNYPGNAGATTHSVFKPSVISTGRFAFFQTPRVGTTIESEKLIFRNGGGLLAPAGLGNDGAAFMVQDSDYVGHLLSTYSFYGVRGHGILLFQHQSASYQAALTPSQYRIALQYDSVGNVDIRQPTGKFTTYGEAKYNAGRTLNALDYLYKQKGDSLYTYTGTTNRISVTANQINIDAAYIGQSTITTVGTLLSGARGFTQTTGDNTTLLATDAFVQQELTANTLFFNGTFSGLGTSASPVYLYKITPKTANYTSVAGDFIPFDTTISSLTDGLPSAPADGTIIGAKMVIQGSTNTVTVNTSGSDVINKTGGSTSFVISLVNQGVSFQYHSGIWYVMNDDLPLGALDTRYLLQTGTTLPSSYINSSLTTLGTITSGTWNGTTIAATHGGTGQGGYATGDMLTALNSTTLTRINIGTTGQVWTVQSGTGLPGWSTPSAGFTNPMTTQYDIIIGGTSGTPTRLAKGADSAVLVSLSGVLGYNKLGLNVSSQFSGSGASVGDPFTIKSTAFQAVLSGTGYVKDAAGTISYITAIPNADLANSTISGISLGGTLANLTATNATLTFSGTYTGNTARTIGLNLGNANTWTAQQSGTTPTAIDNTTKFATTAYVDRNPIVLATITGINSKSTGATALFTVPTGKTAIITACIVRCTAASAITVGPSADVGDSVNGAASVYANTALTTLTTTVKAFGYSSVGIFDQVAAASVINFNINTAATGTSQTVSVTLIGFLL